MSPSTETDSSEIVVCRAVAGGQFGLLAPHRPAAHEHIGRPFCLRAPRPPPCPRRRDRQSEMVTRTRGRWRSGRLAGSTVPAAHKHIGRACIEAAAVSSKCPDHHRVPVTRDGDSEPSSAERRRWRSVWLAGLQLVPLRTNTYAEPACTVAGRIVPRRSDHHRVPVHRDRNSEMVVCRAVAGGQFGLLDPNSRARGARTHTPSPHSSPAAVSSICAPTTTVSPSTETEYPKSVVFRAVAGGQFGL